MTKNIYLDYSATAPLRTSVGQAMKPFWDDQFGNPSSVHSYGRAALDATDAARRQIATLLDCLSSEIVFTGSGTEADNLAIIGLASGLPKGHIVTTAIEHKAVLESCRYLEKWGWQVSYIKPNRQGVVTAKSILDAIQENTRLVSVMYANNEIGTIQPIREIGKGIQKLNRDRKLRIWFHTDGVQAGSLLPLGTKHLHVDMLTLSAHKLGGPKGVGLLFATTGIPLRPIIHGGGQESNRRSGTLNVAGIVGMAAALAECQKTSLKEAARLQKLQTILKEAVTKIAGVEINGSLTDRLASNLNFSWRGKSSDELVIALDRQGIAVSAASACSSGSIQSSYVIEAMGLPEWRSNSTLRVSMGYKTTVAEIKSFVSALRKLT